MTGALFYPVLFCSVLLHSIPLYVIPLIPFHYVVLSVQLLEYVGKGKSIMDVGLAQARQPLTTRSHYFEVEIVDAGEKCYIALGLARRVSSSKSHTIGFFCFHLPQLLYVMEQSCPKIHSWTLKYGEFVQCLLCVCWWTAWYNTFSVAVVMYLLLFSLVLCTSTLSMIKFRQAQPVNSSLNINKLQTTHCRSTFQF